MCAVTLLALALAPFTRGECFDDWIGDGYCDAGCNTSPRWDGGDCCETSCVDAEYHCGYNGYDCQDPRSNTRYVYEKKYSGFTLKLQCDKKAGAGYAIGYHTILTHDQGDLGTNRSYHNDPSVPDECQQQFQGRKMPSYTHPKCNDSRRTKNKHCYDRGHIIAGNHMDGTSLTKTDARYVTNLLPQASGFNQSPGSWKMTEEIIECHRNHQDVDRLEVFGGMTYDDEENDFFIHSHGIPTPDVYYKVVVKHYKNSFTRPDVIAWLMHNSIDDKKELLDVRYPDGDLISVKKLKRVVNDPLSALPSSFTESAYQEGESWDKFDCS